MTAVFTDVSRTTTVAELLACANVVNQSNWSELKAQGLVWTGKNITDVEREIDTVLLQGLIADHGAENIVFGTPFNLCAAAPVDAWEFSGARSVLYWPAQS